MTYKHNGYLFQCFTKHIVTWRKIWMPPLYDNGIRLKLSDFPRHRQYIKKIRSVDPILCITHFKSGILKIPLLLFIFYKESSDIASYMRPSLHHVFFAMRCIVNWYNVQYRLYKDTLDQLIQVSCCLFLLLTPYCQITQPPSIISLIPWLQHYIISPQFTLSVWCDF